MFYRFTPAPLDDPNKKKSTGRSPVAPKANFFYKYDYKLLTLYLPATRVLVINLLGGQMVVYKIPYRRAPCLACLQGRVCRASKGILHTRPSLELIAIHIYNFNVESTNLITKLPSSIYLEYDMFIA